MSEVVPEGWTPENLGDVCSFSGGSAFKEKYQGNSHGDYPFIKVSDMNLAGNEKHISYAVNWITEDVRREAKIKLFPKNSIVFAKVGAALLLNRRRILLRETAIDNNMMAANPLESHYEYLYYFLQSIDFANFVQIGAVPSVNQSQLDSIPINKPTLPEQHKIASILTSVDEVIEKTEAQISKLQDLKKGMMQELLTKGIGHTEFKDSPVGRIPKVWDVYKVSELFLQRKEKGKAELPIYSVLLKGGMVDRSTLERRVSSELKPENNLRVYKGDLAYNMMRMWQGASGIAPVDCMVSPAYVVCSTTDSIDSEYAGYLLKSPQNIQLLHRYSQGLTGDRLRLYFENFCHIKFALPPLSEQKIISESIRAVDERLNNLIKKLEQTGSLKSAIMQDLLTGKVRVKTN